MVEISDWSSTPYAEERARVVIDKQRRRNSMMTVRVEGRGLRDVAAFSENWGLTCAFGVEG